MELPGASSKASCQPVLRLTVLIRTEGAAGWAAFSVLEKKTRRDS